MSLFKLNNFPANSVESPMTIVSNEKGESRCSEYEVKFDRLNLGLSGSVLNRFACTSGVQRRPLSISVGTLTELDLVWKIKVGLCTGYCCRD